MDIEPQDVDVIEDEWRRLLREQTEKQAREHPNINQLVAQEVESAAKKELQNQARERIRSERLGIIRQAVREEMIDELLDDADEEIDDLDQYVEGAMNSELKREEFRERVDVEITLLVDAEVGNSLPAILERIAVQRINPESPDLREQWIAAENAVQATLINQWENHNRQLLDQVEAEIKRVIMPLIEMEYQLLNHLAQEERRTGQASEAPISEDEAFKKAIATFKQKNPPTTMKKSLDDYKNNRQKVIDDRTSYWLRELQKLYLFQQKKFASENDATTSAVRAPNAVEWVNANIPSWTNAYQDLERKQQEISRNRVREAILKERPSFAAVDFLIQMQPGLQADIGINVIRGMAAEAKVSIACEILQSPVEDFIRTEDGSTLMSPGVYDRIDQRLTHVLQTEQAAGTALQHMPYAPANEQERDAQQRHMLRAIKQPVWDELMDRKNHLRGEWLRAMAREELEKSRAEKEAAGEPIEFKNAREIDESIIEKAKELYRLPGTEEKFNEFLSVLYTEQLTSELERRLEPPTDPLLAPEDAYAAHERMRRFVVVERFKADKQCSSTTTFVSFKKDQHQSYYGELTLAEGLVFVKKPGTRKNHQFFYGDSGQFELSKADFQKLAEESSKGPILVQSTLYRKPEWKRQGERDWEPVTKVDADIRPTKRQRRE